MSEQVVIYGVEESPLYKHTEKLLKEYNSMQARVKNLDIDLKQVYAWKAEAPEETISGMMFARPKQEGMPISGSHGDKTSAIAIRYGEERYKDIVDTGRELSDSREDFEHEKESLERTLKKIDNAVASLSLDEQLIIKGFYIEQKPWYDVAHEVQYVERHCKRLRTRAIWYMSKSIFGAGKVRG